MNSNDSQRPYLNYHVFKPTGSISIFQSISIRKWMRRNTGGKGFSPVCNNEWVDGVCEKHYCPEGWHKD